MVDLDVLLPALDARSPRRSSLYHGDLHWQAVAHAGLVLMPEVPAADRTVVFLFALFHDSQRVNEAVDPGHGRRGGRLARELHGTGFELADVQLELLCAACDGHTDVERSDDPTLAVCWDADRLNLWRVGIEPVPRFLSTEPARRRDRIRAAAKWHGTEFGWPALAERYGLRRRRPDDS